MLFVSDDTLQYANIFPQVNLIWEDPEWIAEEWFTGYRTILKSESESNNLFVSKKCCNGFSLGKNLTNNLLPFKTIPVYDMFGGCLLDCLLLSNRGKEGIVDLFEVGSLGAEKLGPFSLILLDVLKFRDADIRNEPWKNRRVYLEEIYSVFKAPNLFIPEVVKENKKNFFNSLINLGSKGVILKNVNAPYSGGMNKNFLRIKSGVLCGHKNNALLKSFTPDKKDNLQFDFDTYLAIHALSNLENINKLRGEEK